MIMAVSSSSAKRQASRLRGPRPQPLKASSSSSSPSSKKTRGGGGAAPVIVYEHTPDVVHARPQEFMTVVQRLTGMPPPPPSSSSPLSTASTADEGAVGDPLLLTLGQRHAAATVPPASPTATGTAMLLSPGFIFSPNTMQAIQELTSLL